MSQLKHLLVQCMCAQLHQYTSYTVLVSNDTLLNSHAHIYLEYALTESLCGAKPIVRHFYELLHFQVSNPPLRTLLIHLPINLVELCLLLIKTFDSNC